MDTIYENESTPKKDGYRMPGEFEPQECIWMLWPHRPDNWRDGAKPAQKAYADVARGIAQFEPVIVGVNPEDYAAAHYVLAGEESILVVEMTSDDSWIRDCGPTFVVNDDGDVRAVHWHFNAWGGLVDGLYFPWDQDALVGLKVADLAGVDRYRPDSFVLEGGSIHSDGQGTILVTESCLLSVGRNPELTKEEIEERLLSYLGGKKVIWLPRGIYNDETNEHVDNICAFTAPGHVVLAWTDDEADPQYELSMACLKALEASVDACGRRLQVHKLPIPKTPICVTEEDLKGYEFEPGEDVREAGERLAASYVNFYISNGGVVVPQFGDENDETAVRILAELFPGRKVHPVAARDILLGGGNIHCITQQIPASGVCESL